ncbi:MAG: ubiquinone/menaquinone biosynthesis methyltransferase [Actinomycetota bacterium]|nr:ubiquinone/menaquinone biosynthesis methyltransferase [Actinomycetota bacterium]
MTKARVTKTTKTTAALPSGREKTVRVRAMFDLIAPRYDLVNRVISLGLDQHWRSRALRALKLAPGSRVLDVACGTGALGEIGARHGYRVVGTDLSAGMLAGRAGRFPATLGDAAALPFATGSFDGVLCAYALRNFTDLEASLEEAARVTRPGGRISILEVATPTHRALRAGHALWFRHVVPVIGALLSDPEAYRYLPDSVAYLPDERELAAMLRHAGFGAVDRLVLQGGLSQVLTGTRASARALR